MTSSADAIRPITLTVDDRTGLTLYAPPWEDEDGEEWQGFLGDGRKILLYPSTTELAAFIQSGEENDLSDHPAYGQVLKATPDELKPGAEDHYDLDQVYEWAGGEPDPVHVSALGDVVDMVGRIADCCDDGALRRLVEGTPAYAELVEDEVSYQGKDGRKRWNELGDTIAESWERAIKRVSDWLEWVGDFAESEFDADDSVWARVGAEPIEIRVGTDTWLTVRAEIPIDPDTDAVEMGFLGEDGSVAVFRTVPDLARYCREATGHRLHKLEWWEELSDLDDDAFTPEDEARFDLRKPSEPATELVLEIAQFCDLDADTDVLDGPSVDRDDWRALVDEVATCLAPQD